MIKKFEKLTTEINPLTQIAEPLIIECAEKEAEYIHYCYHDEDPNKSCQRVRK